MKKAFSVLLVVALLLVLFTSCATSAKKIPTEEEVNVVRGLNERALALFTEAQYVYAQGYDYLGYYNFLYETDYISVKLGCKNDADISILSDDGTSFSIKLDLITEEGKEGNDLTFKGNGDGVITDNYIDLSFSYDQHYVNNIPGFNEGVFDLVASGSIKGGSECEVTFTKVILNGVEYEPSYFEYTYL